MNYLSLAEALVLGQLVTGIDAVVLESASRTELLDSALHAPQAGFGDDDFYSDFFMKAAVLCTRTALLAFLLFPTATNAWPGFV